MKNILLLCAGMALVSCEEISTEPASPRPTKTQTVSVTYSLSATPLPASGDTAPVNPKLEVYLVTPVTQADGSVNYPVTASSPVATITGAGFAAPQPITVGNVVVADGQPAPVVRFVFSSDNLPGRRTAAQRINAVLLVNGTTRTTTTYTGRDFARPTATPPPAAPFRKQTDQTVAIY